MTVAGSISINGREIGAGYPPYVIAELSGNHNGDLTTALRLLEAAATAGADAVKLQTYTADTLTIDHDGADFRIGEGLWKGRTLYDLYNEAHTPWEWHEALFRRGRELNITIFSSPFDASAVDFLQSLAAPAYKIASFEIVDLALIAKAAKTERPLIISTGMANFAEIERAISVAREAGAREVLLLHCVSGYPAPASEYNLRKIEDMTRQFGVPVGLSDHTLGITVPIAAIAAGAVAVEKHVTFQRSDGGVDAAFSLEPAELAEMTKSVREAWQSLGSVRYERTASELPNIRFRRSIYVVRDIAEGELFTVENIRVIRPGYGMHAHAFPKILGRRAKCFLTRGTSLQADVIEGWSDEGEVP